MKNGWECWSGGMAHPYFGREGRMGMVTVFKKDGREGRPSEKNGSYPSLVPTSSFMAAGLAILAKL